MITIFFGALVLIAAVVFVGFVLWASTRMRRGGVGDSGGANDAGFLSIFTGDSGHHRGHDGGGHHGHDSGGHHGGGFDGGGGGHSGH